MIQKSRRSRERRSRRGITLIEVLILVTGVAVMLGLCAVTIQLLLRLHAHSQARVSSTIALERLARQLRDDAHASQGAKLSDGGAKAAAARPSLSLNVEAAHSINYIVGEHAVTRDEIDGGKRTRHESYSLEHGQAARFELIDESGHRMVGLWVTDLPGPSRVEPPKPLQIVASLGKHRSRPISVTEGSKP